MDTAGDGFFASFDGPARAARCARAIVDAVRPLGIEIRAGLHSGECEVIDGKIGGLAVHIGARVGSLAGPSETLVSQTVKDLVAGSGSAHPARAGGSFRHLPARAGGPAGAPKPSWPGLGGHQGTADTCSPARHDVHIITARTAKKVKIGIPRPGRTG